MEQRVDSSGNQKRDEKKDQRATWRAKGGEIKFRAAFAHRNDDFRVGRLGHFTGIAIDALGGGETEAGTAESGLSGRIARELWRGCGSKDRKLEIIGIVDAGNIRRSMQQPEYLIPRIFVVRIERFRGKVKIHRDGATERAGTDSSRRNVFGDLPKSDVAAALILAAAGDDAADAGKAQVDAMGRWRFEAELNSAGKALAGRKRKRVKFEVGIAEAIVTNGGPDSTNDQEDAERAKGEHEDGAEVALTKQLWNHAKEEGKQEKVPKSCENPRADVAFLAQALGTVRGPIGAPEPRRERVGIFERGFLLEESVASERGEDESAADKNKEKSNGHADRSVAVLGVLP